MSDDLEVGAVFRVPYPFIRDTFTERDETGFYEVKTWRPGARPEDDEPDGVEFVADGMGEIILTVVSTHKPGRYPTRVFFTRKWINPDGKEFGKNGCRMTTAGKFRRLVRGYAHAFVMARE